jgi:hypothetical protein
MLIDSTVTQTNLHVYMTGYIGLSSIYMCIVSLMLFVNYKSETCNVFEPLTKCVIGLVITI